jgi:transposase
MQLTEAEALCRALKSELSVRPLFHNGSPRVKAHVMVAFLGYALWVTLNHLLKRRPGIVPKPSAVPEVLVPGRVADEAGE